MKFGMNIMPLVITRKSYFFKIPSVIMSTWCIVKYVRWEYDDNIIDPLRVRDDVIALSTCGRGMWRREHLRKFSALQSAHFQSCYSGAILPLAIVVCSVWSLGNKIQDQYETPHCASNIDSLQFFHSLKALYVCSVFLLLASVHFVLYFMVVPFARRKVCISPWSGLRARGALPAASITFLHEAYEIPVR